MSQMIRLGDEVPESYGSGLQSKKTSRNALANIIRIELEKALDRIFGETTT